MFWVGTEALLKTYDGGADVAITDATGPFWEVDTTVAGKFLLAPGTVGTTVIAVTDTGGSHETTLTTDDPGPHARLRELRRKQR